METLPKSIKTYSHVICVMFVFVALCGCPCGPPTGDCLPDTSQVRDFYWYVCESGLDCDPLVRQDLELLTNKISVKFSDDISEAERDTIIASTPLLRPFSERQIVEGPELQGWYLLRTVDCVTRAEVWELIERFDDAPGVAFAAGVYILAGTGPKEEMQVTDWLNAIVPTDGAAGLEALNAANSVNVFDINDYSDTLGVLSYTLRITELSPLNALDMANMYSETGLVIISQPSPYSYPEPESTSEVEPPL